MRILSVLLGVLVSSQGLAAACAASSGDKTAALVELYTSDGCDRCPPADRWLSGLGERGYAPERLVPLSLHVDYRDYTGWKDPYARPAVSGRQRKLTQLQRLAFVYTPQVMLQGQQFRAWHTPAFDAAVARINAAPAQAQISLSIDALSAAAMEIGLRAELLDKAQLTDAAVYVATYEDRLAGTVASGENRGHPLKHDYVVLEWQGPLEFGTAGARAERRSIPLLPKAVPANSGVVAFVQNRRTRAVLQALKLPACRQGREGGKS
jgi:hypothetical protein